METNQSPPIRAFLQVSALLSTLVRYVLNPCPAVAVTETRWSVWRSRARFVCHVPSSLDIFRAVSLRKASKASRHSHHLLGCLAPVDPAPFSLPSLLRHTTLLSALRNEHNKSGGGAGSRAAGASRARWMGTQERGMGRPAWPGWHARRSDLPGPLSRPRVGAKV